MTVAGHTLARSRDSGGANARIKPYQRKGFVNTTILTSPVGIIDDFYYETASYKKELKTVDIFDKAKEFTVLVDCLH